MRLTAGTRLGHYEILAPLGAGGMGEVYRARDTRLERTVAIKVLPFQISLSPEVRQRFEREARMISQLTHPHICALHDIGREGETDYLVMEFLDGETLSDRLGKGALPLEQALRYGSQIADALDKAHRQGIVHRDLKPGNVMITKSGAKLLDFGLAKSLGPAPSDSILTAPPTETALTEKGAILGTVQYMAPEQLEGRQADARTDIFALGAVLYEMATGQRAFSGASKASLIAAILHTDPPPISTLQPMFPPMLDRVTKTCLAKDPEERWQCAGDVGKELRWVLEGALGARAAAPSLRKTAWIPWALATILALTLVVSLVLGLWRGPESRKSVRFTIAPPEGTSFVSYAPSSTLALSPNGSSLAFVATSGLWSARETSLYVRPFDSLAAIPLKGTEGAVCPFWSPDGRSIGFFAQGKLQKIAAEGGPPQALCDSVFGNGATWGRDGLIHYWEWSGGREGIYRVSAEGGTPTQITSYDRKREGGSPAWPVLLADRRQFLYLAGVFASKEPRRLWAASLGFDQPHPVMNMDSRVAYCDPGYLIFVRDGTLLAQPFDTRALRVTGEPIPVSEHVWFHRATGNAAFSVSENGTLAYSPGPPPSRLAWRDRNGREIGSVGSPGVFNSPRLSPDGTRVAVSVWDPRRGKHDIWIYDVVRGIAQRFTEDPIDAVIPIWSTQGDRIVFASGREGAPDLYVKRVDGAGGEEVLLKRTGPQFPLDWSPDGKQIVYQDVSPGASARLSLWVTAVGAPGDPAPLLRTDFSLYQARYSARRQVDRFRLGGVRPPGGARRARAPLRRIPPHLSLRGCAASLAARRARASPIWRPTGISFQSRRPRMETSMPALQRSCSGWSPSRRTTTSLPTETDSFCRSEDRTLL